MAALAVEADASPDAADVTDAAESATAAPAFNANAARADISMMAGLLQSRLHGIADGQESAAGVAGAAAAGAVGDAPGLDDFAGVYDAGPGASEWERFIKVEVEDGEVNYTFGSTLESFDDDSMKYGGAFTDIGEPKTEEEFNDYNFWMRPSGAHTTRTGQTTLQDGVIFSEGIDEEDRAFNRDDKSVSKRSMKLDGDSLTFDRSRTIYKKGFLGIGGYKLDPDGMNTIKSNPVTYRRVK
jgi:hypothetical protein